MQTGRDTNTKTVTDKLEYLSSRLYAWDRDLRWGHRGFEQLTMFLQDVQRHLERESQVQGQAQGCQEGPADASAPDPLQGYSSEELGMELDPMLLAKFRQLATWCQLQVPALLEAIDRCEAALHPDDVAGLAKREAAREFPCGRF
jgi:hypothetical protein